MPQFALQYAQVQQHIQQACEKSGRAATSVQLLAVSKTHPASAITAFYQLGQRAFGENYLQEALDKIEQLKQLSIEWHFIGHVQRNKTKHLAENFAWVHGVDRLIIAERLSNQRPENLAPLNLCLQVNIDDQESKDGCRVDEVADLVAQISQLPNIQLRGLMVIPKPEHSAAFAQTKQLFDQVKARHHHPEQWDTLSMGMSGDLDAAIAAGATIVRIGTALFGARNYNT
ncbi:YggS family pyridoxal phosphate-dependent enzyme [Acinetobacter populi]|uniref:Pyridoxal phosphate homeostasis protein n=1 Tax=Acinetobacter populi TaxID=1582270 RepID=A0A1Z9Z1I8_9GAMM|nr:YggS family pyridoxal phosphate-dependent enzyme [Acinetobacter populi]OUY08306.1 YggS family pyridoxal phosphate enzyme [Acinetobacter populi]